MRAFVCDVIVLSNFKELFLNLALKKNRSYSSTGKFEMSLLVLKIIGNLRLFYCGIDVIGYKKQVNKNRGAKYPTFNSKLYKDI